MNDHKTKTIIIDEQKASLLRKSFELYATGNYLLKTLRDILHKEGLIGKKDKPLIISNIEYLLKNPVYYGVIRYNVNYMKEHFHR